MMNQIQVFKYENADVRTVIKNGEPWWIAKDVCDVFGETNRNRAMQALSDDEKGYTQMTTPKGVQKLAIVNEAGLYALLFAMNPNKARGVTSEYIKERQEKLENFKHWVTHEVLPSIRKYGAYITTDKMEELMSNPDTWITLITALKNERQEKEKLQVHNVELQTQIEIDKPKVIFADAVSASDCDILVGSLAKILKANGIDMGQNRLFKRLRKDGFLVQRKNSAYNLPTQRAMNLGLFTIKETAITHSDGHISVNKTVKVTGKGQQYLLNYFLQKKDGKNEDEQDELHKGENQ